jgi:hypothetical protein
MGNGACIGFKNFTSFIAMARVATGMADTAGTVYRGRGALPFAAQALGCIKQCHAAFGHPFRSIA